MKSATIVIKFIADYPLELDKINHFDNVGKDCSSFLIIFKIRFMIDKFVKNQRISRNL